MYFVCVLNDICIFFAYNGLISHIPTRNKAMTKGDLLDREFDFYLASQQKLAEQYQGRYIVIKGQEVLGDYAKASDAVRETSKNHVLGTFLVQFCDTDPESTRSVFHSRVIFA